MKKRILITGGCGFIGINTAKKFKSEDWSVDILDDLSRSGVDKNLDWMKINKTFDSFYQVNITNEQDVNNIIMNNKYDLIVHLAAQVAVTTSLINPIEDFKVNVIGTLNILEALRKFSKETIIIYASTNKVYGNLDYNELLEENRQYISPTNPEISEKFCLDFQSPYGCSKGAADQYVVDYSRSYGLRTIVLRQSCIFGEFQRGVEDQGWVAWFAYARLTGKEVTIYGNGKQVRDLLFAEDLIDAYKMLYHEFKNLKNNVFNIGGGFANSISIIDALNIIDQKLGLSSAINYEPARLGDQKYFVSNNSLLEDSVSWRPKWKIDNGIDSMLKWIENNSAKFR